MKKKFRYLLICALFAVPMVPGNAQTRKLPQAFQQWLESPSMRHATVALEIVDLDTDELCYSVDAQRLVQPASLMKLVTTGAAVRLLGGDYVICDSISCVADTSLVPIPELLGYNPDWMIEDVGSSYIEPLTNIPDTGLKLREFIRKTNENSLNANAEMLVYHLSPEHALQAGLDTIRNYWQSRGLDTDGLVMYDGCGLAPNDRMTARFMSELLREMKDEEDFRSSLAIAGRTGTVINFLKSSVLSGRAYLKTGTTKSVTAYAGYATGSNNHTYSVVLIVNNSSEKLTLLRKEIEKMFNLLIL
ncbi:MAG: D-alanyl-D-alanine carboxypeptidase [Bacteroidales bacterium]|nr:D-alanyl-D-alanine carboxypeptidase [Bacteroidales bacterium]MBP5213666.1 D-alanyl-D-alanine carboxypeptidase [Bacteroidales bacterium]MBP5764766.1 D-alanyl-D-alanine carboxypeptidase [Bacteroidales bacterium]